MIRIGSFVGEGSGRREAGGLWKTKRAATRRWPPVFWFGNGYWVF